MRVNKYLMFIVAILALGFSVSGAPVIRAQDPTIPTRTPTPGSGEPPPGPTATSDEPGNPPPPAPTDPSNPDPGASPSATTSTTGPESPAATITPITSPGGQLPAGTVAPGGTGTTGSALPSGSNVAGDCDETPYAEAIKTVVVFAGPGNDYETVAELGPEEMRPIIGRAYYAMWWQIQVDLETIGWVADAEVIEYGNTALVPLVESPSINGNTPTPGAIWNPTPLPLLTCVPTPTPTATATIPAALPASSVGGGTNGSEGAATSQLPTPTVGMVSAEVGSSAPVGQGSADPAGLGVSSRDAEASRTASPTQSTNLILPLAGLALISGGIVVALLSRNQGGSKPESPESEK